MSDGYQGLPTGDKWGCVTAALVGIPLFCFLLMLDALGDCAPDTSCRKGFLVMVLLPAILIAGIVFAGVRAIIRSRKSNDR